MYIAFVYQWYMKNKAGMMTHRLVPLHMGKVIGDAIQCGYHGLQFDGHGACVHNPHDPIPRRVLARLIEEETRPS
jgi:nitrite reductase/ring-hydroxylating ferredoxin subunit